MPARGIELHRRDRLAHRCRAPGLIGLRPAESRGNPRSSRRAEDQRDLAVLPLVSVGRVDERVHEADEGGVAIGVDPQDVPVDPLAFRVGVPPPEAEDGREQPSGTRTVVGVPESTTTRLAT